MNDTDPMDASTPEDPPRHRGPCGTAHPRVSHSRWVDLARKARPTADEPDLEPTCDERGIRHGIAPWQCPGACRPCPGCARCNPHPEPFTAEQVRDAGGSMADVWDALHREGRLGPVELEDVVIPPPRPAPRGEHPPPPDLAFRLDDPDWQAWAPEPVVAAAIDDARARFGALLGIPLRAGVPSDRHRDTTLIGETVDVDGHRYDVVSAVRYPDGLRLTLADPEPAGG